MSAHLRRWSAILALVACTGVTAPALAAPTAPPVDGEQGSQQQAAAPDDQDLVSFGIAPAGAEHPDERPYLSFSAAPGSTIYDHVAVLNQADVPLSLAVYSGDVVQADSGLSVLARDEADVDAGSWITIDGPGDLEVPAQTAETGVGYTIVPFTLTIPADAQPGDHLGGIVASLVTTGQSGSDSPSIRFDQRVAARVYIRVDGDLAPGLVVRDLTADWRPGSLLGLGAGSVDVTYSLENTGNVRMAVEPTTQVAGPSGLLARSAAGPRIDDLLPGARVEQSITLDGVWPLVRDRVTVSARAVASSVGQDPGLGTVTASTHVWAVPWLLLALMLLLVAAVAARMRRRRRAARRTAARDGEPGRRRASRRQDVRSGTGTTATPLRHAGRASRSPALATRRSLRGQPS